MSRRLHLGLILIVSMCLLFPRTTWAAANLTDIRGHWAEQQILLLQSGGYITGFPDNTFQPDQPMTRAGFVTVLVNCLGGTKAEDFQTVSFSDTKGHWSLASINRAVKLGIILTAEYPNGLGPDNPIKRSEAAAMLVRALGQQPDNTGTLNFKDATEIEKSLYKGYIKKATDSGLISGYTDGYFRPFTSLTRSQTCALMIRMLEILGKPITTTPTTPTTPSTTGNPGQVVRIGSEQYSLNNNLIYISSGGQTKLITQLQLLTDRININSTNEYLLGSIMTGVDLIVNNNRFPVSSFSVVNGELLVSSPGRKLVSATVNGLKYNAEMVNVYVTGESTVVYLSDVLILDANTIQIGSRTYNLLSQQVFVTLSGQSYRIRGVLIGNTDSSLILDAAASTYFRYPRLADINEIYVNNYSLAYNSGTARLFFIINEEKYELGNITIEASGNISAGGTNYLPSQVIMFYNDNYYKLSEIRFANQGFSIYCTYSDITSWVRINDKYRSAQGVQIIRDGNLYNLNDIQVVSRNLIRIGGRQYTLDSTFKARYDGQTYDITDINYDSVSNGILLTTRQTSYISSSLPYRYVFYESNSLLQSSTSGVLLYAGSSQISFDNITGIDPLRFTWNGSSYDLIGGRIRLNGIDYTITDTVWRGSTSQFEIYLRRL